MRAVKRAGGIVLSMAMALSLLAPAESMAAKQPKMSKSRATVQVGKTLTLSVKNAAKKAKITWGSKQKKIAKVVQSSNKKAKIRGVKAGKATITAKYKLGKKKKTLSCKVTVQDKSTARKTVTPTGAPSSSPLASSVPPAPSAVGPSAPAATDQPASETPAQSFKWVTTWGTAEEKCDVTKDAMPKQALPDTTVREIIRVTTGGDKLRLRLSNQYGDSDVEIKSMHLAKQVKADESTIDPATDQAVTFEGSEEFVIPAGQVIVTDEVAFPVNALDNVAVSIYFGTAPEKNVTGHRGARATTYQVEGNQVSEETFKRPKTTTSWFFLADVSIWSPAKSKAVVCFGDSITDGYGTDATYLGKKPDSYTRWIDYFAKRLQADESKNHISLINEGIGANSILDDYPTDAGKDRFARDLLEHDGVAYCIILFGVNDLNKLPNASKYNELLPEYQKMVKLCHDNGIKVYGAPILPFGTSDYYSEGSEQVRTMINDWMRSADSQMDGIIDFESAVADPENPKNVLEDYTHDDGLHPYDGYEAMANAIDLKLFE